MPIRFAGINTFRKERKKGENVEKLFWHETNEIR